MRLRALGVALILFGFVGALGSFGAWWVQFRYGRSITDFASVEIACKSHCGGVDGLYLAGVIVSGGVSLVGLAAVVVSFVRGQSAAS